MRPSFQPALTTRLNERLIKPNFHHTAKIRVEWPCLARSYATLDKKETFYRLHVLSKGR